MGIRALPRKTEAQASASTTKEEKVRLLGAGLLISDPRSQGPRAKPGTKENQQGCCYDGGVEEGAAIGETIDRLKSMIPMAAVKARVTAAFASECRIHSLMRASSFQACSGLGSTVGSGGVNFFGETRT